MVLVKPGGLGLVGTGWPKKRACGRRKMAELRAEEFLVLGGEDWLT